MITEKCSLSTCTKKQKNTEANKKKALATAAAAAAGGICGNSFKTVGKAPGTDLMKLVG